MEYYQPNSHKYKNEKGLAQSEKKKVEKAIQGTAKVKKSNELRKITDIFISEDIANVKSYIVMDVLIPTIKKAVSDIIKNGIDMILYGSVSPTRSNSTANRISYSKYYDDNRNTVRDSRAKSGFRSDDIIFDNRGEAEIVLSRMDELIDTYGIVTIADLYDLAGVTGDYTTNNYGWTNIRNAEVVRVRDGYIIKMPKAIPIDNVENRIEEKDESDLIKAINDLLMEDSYNDPYGIYFVDIDIF